MIPLMSAGRKTADDSGYFNLISGASSNPCGPQHARPGAQVNSDRLVAGHPSSLVEMRRQIIGGKEGLTHNRRTLGILGGQAQGWIALPVAGAVFQNGINQRAALGPLVKPELVDVEQWCTGPGGPDAVKQLAA